MLEEQELRISAAVLQSYASGKADKLQLQVYHTIASVLNEKYGAGLEQKALPDVCGGFYVGMLLAWYFDKVDTRTKGLENPMPVAVEIFLSEVAQADERIAVLSRGTKGERHVAECFARDVLTREAGPIPYSVFSKHEMDVIASLRVYQNAVTPIQLKGAFEGADRRIAIVTGYKASAFLGSSLEAGLNVLADQARRANPIPYSYDGHNTLQGTQYDVGDWIIHDNPRHGLGKVVMAEVVQTKKAANITGFWQPHRECEYRISVEFANEPGKIRPFIVRPKP